MSKPHPSLIANPRGGNYLVPFLLVTSLFFLWGFAHSLLDVLNKHFQEILGVSKAQSGLVQAAVYGGYFIMAIPAGLFMKRFGYKKGILLGLLLYACGAFLFYPAVHIQEFWAFLAALFVIALGLTCLETAANPYATVLGPQERSAQRLNLSQSFNGLGWVIGPIVGSLILFATSSGDNKFASLAIPYIGIGIIVLLVAFLFFITKLPDIDEAVLQHDGENEADSHAPAVEKPLFRHPHFIFAVIAQFFYVAAQTGINSFFINYVTDIFHKSTSAGFAGAHMLQRLTDLVGRMNPGISEYENLLNTTAGLMLSFSFGLFMAGRFLGSLLLTWIKPSRLLLIYSILCMVLTGLVITGAGMIGIVSLSLIYLFMSVMFPTIFALGLKSLGSHTRRASSFIVMAIVGGAVFTPIMGYIADISSMQIGFVIPLVCFTVVMLFALRSHDLTPTGSNMNRELKNA
jgi:FHS family L-fucose permease-like MFS transporter